ncbi:MAG: hypothetical protein ACXADB_10130 [Candidatus Hermodarchaeia archaeon]|jgi:hypothetical protein
MKKDEVLLQFDKAYEKVRQATQFHVAKDCDKVGLAKEAVKLTALMVLVELFEEDL